MQRWRKQVLLGLATGLVVAQFVPVKRDNPPIDPAMTVYSVEAVPSDVSTVFERSCKDCHSNQTVWPWYSYIAPVSWMVASDVHDGRGRMNLSEWAAYNAKKRDLKLGEVCEKLNSGDMPDSKYTLIHRNARLTAEERTSVCAWAENTRKISSEQPRANTSGSGGTH